MIRAPSGRFQHWEDRPAGWWTRWGRAISAMMARVSRSCASTRALEILRRRSRRFGHRSLTKLPIGTYSTPRWSPDDRLIAAVREPGGEQFANNLLVVDVCVESRDVLKRHTTSRVFHGSRTALGSSSARRAAARCHTRPRTTCGWSRSMADPRRSSPSASHPTNSPICAPTGTSLSAACARRPTSGHFRSRGSARQRAAGHPDHRQTGLVQTVSVSPDESEVVFLSDNGGHANAWTARIADGEMRPVTREFDPRVVVAVPVWSPLGSWINFLSNRNSQTPDVTLWLVKPDERGARPWDQRGLDVLVGRRAMAGTSSASRTTLPHQQGAGRRGATCTRSRRQRNRGCQTARDGFTLNDAKILTQASGAWDFELRQARAEDGPSEVIGRVAGARVPAAAINFHAFLSPDGQSLAMPLLDGSTTNLWALSTATGQWRKLLDFGERNVVIARRVAWSKEGRHVYASVAEVESDIVMLVGLSR